MEERGCLATICREKNEQQTPDYMSKSADAVFADEAIKLLRVKLASRAPAHFVGAEACLVR